MELALKQLVKIVALEVIETAVPLIVSGVAKACGVVASDDAPAEPTKTEKAEKPAKPAKTEKPAKAEKPAEPAAPAAEPARAFSFEACRSLAIEVKNSKGVEALQEIVKKYVSDDAPKPSLQFVPKANLTALGLDLESALAGGDEEEV